MVKNLIRCEIVLSEMYLGITGDVNDVRGNVNECGITQQERSKGINISELIKDKHDGN